MHEKRKGIFAVIGTYSIFGLNLVFCKDLMASSTIGPAALFSVRAFGAMILFWVVSFFLPVERVERKDLPRLFCASLLGMLFPQLCTMVGLTMSTPFDASVISSFKPVITVIVASIMMKARIGYRTIIGVAICLSGALMLIYSGNYDSVFKTTPLGLLLLLGNGVFFSVYLVAFKDLVSKYNPVTYMKWVFLFAAVTSLIFSIRQFKVFRIESMTTVDIVEIGFSIFFATFLSYFFAPIGQKRLHPVTYSIFSYTQILVASVVGILVGVEIFRWEKVAATIFLILGSWIVCATQREIPR